MPQDIYLLSMNIVAISSADRVTAKYLRALISGPSRARLKEAPDGNE
jgi:hypothetical protein